MDIFEDTCDHDSVENLELERFKVKIREIWNRLLEECYAKYPTEGMDLEHFKEHNALHFADEPQPEDEIDNLMSMLDELMNPMEELDSVTSGGKAPTYGSTTLKANKEQGKKEAGTYEFKHTTTKTPSDSRARKQGGSYVGTPTGKISKRTSAKVVTKYSPLIEEIKDELKDLAARQAIGKRRQLFR